MSIVIFVSESFCSRKCLLENFCQGQKIYARKFLTAKFCQKISARTYRPEKNCRQICIRKFLLYKVSARKFISEYVCQKFFASKIQPEKMSIINFVSESFCPRKCLLENFWMKTFDNFFQKISARKFLPESFMQKMSLSMTVSHFMLDKIMCFHSYCNQICMYRFYEFLGQVFLSFTLSRVKSA